MKTVIGPAHDISQELAGDKLSGLTGDADNDEWLSRKEREDNGAEDRGQENLVDAILGARVLEHVKREGQSRQDTGPG